MSLKELTWEKHKSAERQDFVKVLLSGRIHPDFYKTYLVNQRAVYSLLEIVAKKHQLLEGLEDIVRADAIRQDLVALEYNMDNTVFVPVVNEYLDRILKLSRTNPNLLMAHIYVRHMGDLYGGQMIAKKVPGPNNFYHFDNIEDSKEKIRSRLDDSLAEEANLCFDFAIELYKQMMELNMPKYIDE